MFVESSSHNVFKAFSRLIFKLSAPLKRLEGPVILLSLYSAKSWWKLVSSISNPSLLTFFLFRVRIE